MKFSVLVPVYNVENYIEECLDSILRQTYQDYELILVDDGSTDRSGEICDDYRERFPERIRVIHKKNQGLISARRVGINEATGEFCVFVDSDDFVENNLLVTINSYLEHDSKVDVLLYSFSFYRNEKKEKRQRVVAEDGAVWVENNKKEIYEKLCCGSDISSIWTKAIRTSILKGDPTNYEVYYGKNMAEDILQSLYPLTAAERIMYADKILYNYRINQKSISRSFKMETLDTKNAIHVYKKILEYLPIWDMDNDVIKKRINAKWFNDTMYLFSNYYNSTMSKEQKRALVLYDWKSWIPEGEDGKRNLYINRKYIELYNLLEKKKKRSIEKYFFCDNLKKKIKEIKKRTKRKYNNE